MAASTGALPVHRLHDEEIERLLATGERRADLTALFGEQGYRELSALARRAAARRGPTGPRVYVLPGLMGSRIGSRGVLLDDVLWVDLIEIAAGHLTRLALPGGSRLVALGAMLLNTLKLKLSLRIAGFDARLHPYDWRRSVSDLAAELNARIGVEAPAGEVLLVGHSMGGVVARVALGRQHSARIRRVVQLGAPNHGSFAPVLALRAVYPSVRKLAALDRRHSAEDLSRIVFRTLPALHELLPDPLLAGGTNLFDAESWPDDALRPDARLLEAAAAEQASWPEPDERCLHIAGVRQDTVVAATLRDAEFEYSLSPAGDATVPLALAVRPGQQAWYVGEKHGGLPNNGRVIAAIVDLLHKGRTQQLPRTASRVRRHDTRTLSEASLRRVAPHKVRWQHLSPDARRRLLEPVVSPEFHGAVVPAALERAFAANAAQAAVVIPARRVLELRLVQGSIVDANARAIVLGVFRNVDPSGPAAAVDAALGGAIREFTLRRMFGGQLGQVFVMPALRSALLAELVLFAGLGDFDDFGADALAFVAENVVRTFAHTHVEDFATVLFGAGSGTPVAMAAEQQLKGFLDGLRHADPDRVLRRITVCEVDRRKYASLVKALRRLALEHSGDDMQIVVDEAAAPSPPGKRPRGRGVPKPAARHDDPAYLLVTLAAAGRDAYESRTSLLTAGAKAAVLSGTSRLARAELQRQLAPLEDGSAMSRDVARIGSGLARLLLANSVRDGLESMRSRPLVVVHDREASRVPWEVLRVGDAHPALLAGLSRRYASETLTVARWREERVDDGPLRVLLVVDPTEDLPGAAAEGDVLQLLLRGRAVSLDVLQGREATRKRLLAALSAGTYDALHFAGHAFFDARQPADGGLLCAGKEVLRGADLAGLGTLPALVFCNACEAARVRKRGAKAPRPRGPARLLGARRSMTGIAEAFLAGGVANFMGTHWPVGDEPALAFSRQLYETLLHGDALGDAVLAARRRVAAIPSIDWADYVHYGNAGFRLVAR
ncbi:MAG TPA: CHAT domain-containing protein [Steroidobacteraceae bacterium]|nr:CHAT domain-containing protein [Steroidobacteraceae bacterium]